MRTEDGYIINKCLNGNSAAFGFLVDKYKAAVYAFAYAELRNFHDAEDVTQEVFVKAYQKLRTLRRWDNFLAWLYSITSNLCRMWIRSQSRRPDREFIEDQDPEALEEPSVDPHRENPVFELLNEALDSLPKAYRQVLTLYYLGGMNSVEIARFLGMSPTAIRQRLTRARSQLKEGMLAMMSQTFEGQRLQAGFTFRIVEAVKRVKIQPMPRMTGLPWGLSLAAGIVLTIMSLSPHLNISNHMTAPTGSPLPSETKVLKTGEIPVDILKISQISVLASKNGNGDGVEPEFLNLQNALFMAPQDGGDTWTKKADMPTARYALSASTVGGKIYAIGGWSRGIAMAPPVEEYDPATDRWRKKADMPTPRGYLATGVVDGKIYAIGGNISAAVEEYDPVVDKWTKKTDMPTARGFLSASVVNGKIYVIGGLPRPQTTISTVEEYEPVEDKWTRKDDILTDRMGLSTCAVNGRIYAIGGQRFDNGLQGWILLATVEEYNPVTDKWTKKADMPTKRWGLSTSMVNGKIYAIGGWGEDVIRHLAAVEEYDPVMDKWTKKADMPTGRDSLATSVVNGKIYAIGGQAWNNNFSTVEEYDPGSAGQNVEATGKLPTTWGEEKRHGDRATR